MISNSDDGKIIATVVENMGFKTVRGSSNRKGCVSGTMQMVERLKAGECGAIMVDGPRGPLREVKNGIIKIAKLTNAPIVPVVWYCPQFNFVKLPSEYQPLFGYIKMDIELNNKDGLFKDIEKLTSI